MRKIQEVMLEGIKFLKNNDITSYNLDAKLILMYVLDIDKVKLLTTDEYMDEDLVKRYYALLEDRANNKPVAYITNKCEFMSLDFYVDENVLIPRGDTEILVEEVIQNFKTKNYKNFIDMCTGSGCIAVSLCSYTEGFGVAVDISSKALDIAKKNAIVNGVQGRIQFIESDLFEKLENIPPVDVITSNPPYITFNEMEELSSEVVDHEPHIALFGGDDGLYFYRIIVPLAYEKLNFGGMIFFEIGRFQGKDVSQILKENKFENIRILKDLQGFDRVVLGEK